MSENIQQSLNNVSNSVDNIKVNTLYLELQQWHQEALNCLQQLSQLNMQYDNLGKFRLTEKYKKIIVKISELNLQLLFLKK